MPPKFIAWTTLPKMSELELDQPLELLRRRTRDLEGQRLASLLLCALETLDEAGQGLGHISQRHCEAAAEYEEREHWADHPKGRA